MLLAGSTRLLSLYSVSRSPPLAWDEQENTKVFFSFFSGLQQQQQRSAGRHRRVFAGAACASMLSKCTQTRFIYYLFRSFLASVRRAFKAAVGTFLSLCACCVFTQHSECRDCEAKALSALADECRDCRVCFALGSRMLRRGAKEGDRAIRITRRSGGPQELSNKGGKTHP